MIKKGRPTKVVKLSKLGEQQLNKLHKRGIKITRKEFKEYYDNLRKANRKIGSKFFQENSLKARKLTYNIDRIKTRKDFLKNRRNVLNILKPNYRKELNIKHRNIFYNNLINALGWYNAQEIIKRFDTMTDRELLLFFSVNKDIESMLYDSENPIAEYIDLTVEKFNNRLDVYKYELKRL